MSAGSVLNFGADPLGNDDSYPAFQAAIDSPHAVEVPPGYYYISQPIRIDKPKIINFSRPLLEPFIEDPRRRSSRGPGPNVKESHSRLWTDQNINMFEVRSPDVYFRGGTFDFQNVVGWDKACFYYPAEAVDQNNRGAGWGGGAEDFLILGNYLDLLGLGGPASNPHTTPHTGKGVHIDPQSENAVNWSYWTHMRFDGKVRGVDIAFLASEPHPTLKHFFNQIDLRLEVGYSKQAVVNKCVGELELWLQHQGRFCFMSREEADSRASIESTISIRIRRCDMFDFAQLPDTGRDETGKGDFRWMNQKTFNFTNPKGWGDTYFYDGAIHNRHFVWAIENQPAAPFNYHGPIELKTQGDWQNPIRIGSYFYWHDDNGKLRVRDRKPSYSWHGLPASD